MIQLFSIIFKDPLTSIQILKDCTVPFWKLQIPINKLNKGKVFDLPFIM